MDKNTMHYFQFLDRFLLYLYNSQSEWVDRSEVEVAFYGQQQSEVETKTGIKGTLIMVLDPKKESQAAIKFLEQENLITNYNDLKFKITYQGIMKLARGGFKQEYESNEINKKLQRNFWTYQPWIAFLALLLGILNLIIKW